MQAKEKASEFLNRMTEEGNKLEDKIRELKDKRFFSQIESDINKLKEKIKEGAMIYPPKINSLMRSYENIEKIGFEYKETMDFGACAHGHSSKSFEKIKENIEDSLKECQKYMKKEIITYVENRNKEFNKFEDLKKIDKQEQELKNLEKISRILVMKEHTRMVSDDLINLYDERNKLAQKLGKKRGKNFISREFTQDYKLRLSQTNSSYSLEIRNGEDKVAIRKVGKSDIVDSKRVRKEIIEDLTKLDLGIDPEHAETEYLNSMIGFREFIDERSNEQETNKKIMSAEDRIKSLKLLKDPSYLYKVKQTLDEVIVNENNLKLANYVIGCGAVFAYEKNIPQGMFIQSKSSSGKTHVTSSTLRLFPKENVIHIVDDTPKTLKYFKKPLWNKILFIEEWTKCQDENAKILRQMLSGSSDAGMYTVENKGGTRATEKIQIEGVPVFMAGTVMDSLEDQMANRCWLLYTDVSPKQTKEVMDFKIKSEIANERRENEFDNKSETYKNCIENLTLCKVVNIFSGITTEFFEGDDVSDRRHQPKFEGFIKNITRIHQYQRHNIDLEGENYALTSLGDVFMGLKIMEPYMKLTTSRISRGSQILYQDINSIYDGEGLRMEEIIHSSNEQKKDIREITKSVRELVDNEFVERVDNRYHLKNNKFRLDEIKIDRDKFEKNIRDELQDKIYDLERIGVSVNDSTMDWSGYCEKVVDPIKGDMKEISIIQYDKHLEVKIQ